MNKLLITAILAVNAVASAGTLGFRFGQGFGDTNGKNLEAVYRPYGKFFSPRFVVGALNEGNIQGGTNTLHGGIDASFVVHTDGGLYLGVSQGISILSGETKRLDNTIQYPTTLEAGLYNRDGYSIGLTWKHFSSGKVSKGNKGQEYIGIEVKIPCF